MMLYHGSTVDILNVDLAKSKPNKDFGRAFYLSDDDFSSSFKLSGLRIILKSGHTSFMTIEQIPMVGLCMITTSCMAL